MATGQLLGTPDASSAAQVVSEMQLLAAAKKAFEQADADSGGTLDREEVRKLLLELQCEVHADTDNEYFLQVFKRFDIDDSGALEYVPTIANSGCKPLYLMPDLELESYSDFTSGRRCRYDEFLQCYRFIQANKNDTEQSGGGSETPQRHTQSIRRTLSLRAGNKRRPNLKRGRVTWCCGSFGPQLKTNQLRPLVNFIIFQNAMAMAQITFNIWQVGSSSEYFTEPRGIPGGMLLLQGSLFALQMVHTSFVLLPMFALVRQMGKQYNARLFGAVAGKAITQWAGRAKKKAEANSHSGMKKSLIGGLTKTRSKVVGLSPARLASRKKDQYAVNDHDGTQSASAESWEDEEPRSSIEMEIAHNATADDGSHPSASELLSQGKLPCLPPVPAPVNKMEQLQANDTSSALPPVVPPRSPKAHPLGIQQQNP